MPAFLLMLLGGLATAAGSLVGRVLIALGIGYVSYLGLDTALDAVRDQIHSTLTGLPLVMVQVLSTLKFDVCINIVLSAFAARLVLGGLTSGAVTKMVIK